jgi:hypothetical protein
LPARREPAIVIVMRRTIVKNLVNRAAVFALTISLGCRGGGDGGVRFDAGVDGSKAWRDLSTSEAMTVCENTRAYARARLGSSSFRESACRASGLFLASVSQDVTTDGLAQSACRGGYSRCISYVADGGVPPYAGNGVSDPCASVYGSMATCTATVDQYTACVDESFALTSTSYPPCSELTVAELNEFRAPDGGVWPGLEEGPACQTFLAACPGAPVPHAVPIAF